MSHMDLMSLPLTPNWSGLCVDLPAAVAHHTMTTTRLWSPLHQPDRRSHNNQSRPMRFHKDRSDTVHSDFYQMFVWTHSYSGCKHVAS